MGRLAFKNFAAMTAAALWISLGGCATDNMAPQAPDAPEAEAMVESSQEVVADVVAAVSLSDAIAQAPRSDGDRARDAGRKPAEVLNFIGVAPGMTVVDLIAAGGWYTEVLAAAVGSEGTVYAQNPAAVLKFRDGANDKEMTARLADGRLPNVVRLDAEVGEFGIEPGSVDVIFTALNFHDVYNRDPAQAVGLAQVMKSLLKPGGVLGLVDHDGNEGADNAKLHRMQKSQAVTVLESVGFVVTSSDVLANAEDDRTQFVFAEGLRGATDRFVLRAMNPAG